MAVGFSSAVWGQNVVTGFTLIDADTDVAVAGFDPIPSGGTINLADLASTNVNIRVNTTPATDFGSVQMNLSGATVKGQLENVPPWALWGDSSGNYNAGSLNTGAHSMTATPYDANGGAGGTGTAGTPLTIPFTVIDVSVGPPTVSITSPLNGTTVNEPANFLIQADASDPGGSVTQVEFFEGGTTSLGVDATAPYEVVWNGVTAGSYTLTAEATDDETNTTTSAPVTVNVVVPGVGGTVSGELKKWHKVTVTFDGPSTNEGATPNPFMDYKLDVTFTGPDGRVYVVPGYYAADGNAANTGATAGNKWRAHLAPDVEGEWSYTASFRMGTDVAVDDTVTGTSTSFDGASGTFVIGPSDKGGRDFRGKGRLQYVGGHYLRFADSKEYFLKQGADAPENFLAYAEFDGPFKTDGQYNTGTFANEAESIKEWSAHAGDWMSGDPTWGQVDGVAGTYGQEIIGALNYLASEGMNVFSFLTFNIKGDDRNVFMYTDYNERARLDVSRLDQWEVVFEHADELGMFLHFKTQETENDDELDSGNVGDERTLYYRELIARYAHHLGLNWNLGEENRQTTAQRQAMAQYFRDHDPYDHLIVLHTFPGEKNAVYTPLLGSASELTGVSLQGGNAFFNDVHGDVTTWVANSAGTSPSKPWVVAYDEPGNAQDGLIPDVDEDGSSAGNQVSGRKNALWGTLLGGGCGNEWYFGYGHPHSDLTCEDFRSRDQWWDVCRYALEFFEKTGVPFWEMTNDNTKSSASDDYCFFKAGDAYVVYLEDGGTTNLDMTGESGDFSVRWYDPRNGGAMQLGSVTEVTGGSSVSLGAAPGATTEDWVILVEVAKDILFIRGADRSGGLGSGGNITTQLADIADFSTSSGNTGWGELANLLRAEGYTVTQVTETAEAPTGSVDGVHIDLENENLSQYAAVVFGSNNANDYDAAAIDAVESYVRGGGAALFISDANFGRDWRDAADSDQLFLDRFGLIMNQDQGTYEIGDAVGEVLEPGHPILSGVSEFRGEGVSPLMLASTGAPPAGVTLTRVTFRNLGGGGSNATRLNNPPFSAGNQQGPSCNLNNVAGDADCPPDILDRIATMVVGDVDAGRVVGFFDRNTFFNANGAGGADLNLFDHTQLAKNLFGWLVNDPPVVGAGADFSVVLPAGGTLAGSVSDDGCPADASLMVAWSKVSGPGGVVFGDDASATTGVSFGMPGVYVLRITGDDGEKETSAEVTVTVNDSFAAWAVREACGNTDPNADDDEDGVTAFGEYAAGADAKVADRELATPLVEVDGGSLAIVYRRLKFATDVTYTPQRSGTLGSGAVWDGTGSLFVETVIADDGVVETVRATLVEAIQPGLNVFLRVRYSN
ncbi:MAG: DUF5060 domain-containing protein [Verrucomicrobiota bacterium]